MITDSDIYVSSTDGAVTVPLTETSDALEMNPSWSPDGKSLAFDDRGTIYLLPLTGE